MHLFGRLLFLSFMLGSSSVMADDLENAWPTYSMIASQFNRDLAGHYPFAGLDHPDVDPASVRAFLAAYKAHRNALNVFLTAPNQSAKWLALQAFVKKLDGVATFFGEQQCEADQCSKKLLVNFRARPNSNLNPYPNLGGGIHQLISLRLSSGESSASYPNGASTLQVTSGQSLRLDMQWADRSIWQPVPDTHQSDLTVDHRNGSFTASGPWSLLRFIDAHRLYADCNKNQSGETILKFNVPLQHGDNHKPGLAVIYISLSPVMCFDFPRMAPDL